MAGAVVAKDEAPKKEAIEVDNEGKEAKKTDARIIQEALQLDSGRGRCSCSPSNDDNPHMPRRPVPKNRIECGGYALLVDHGVMLCLPEVQIQSLFQFYFLLMIFSLVGLVSFVQKTAAEGNQWPTISGGDQDNSHVLTHQSNSFKYISREMSNQNFAGETRTYELSETTAATTTMPGTHQCMTQSGFGGQPDAGTNGLPEGIERQQSQLRYDWVIDIVIKHKKEDGNLFTESNIKAMKEVTDLFYEDENFLKYCWKRDGEDTCAYSNNPINDFYPSITTDDLSEVNGEEIYMSEAEKELMGFTIGQHVMLATQTNLACDIEAFKNIGPADTTALQAACGTNPCSPECQTLCVPFSHCSACSSCIQAGWAEALLPAQHCGGYTAFCAQTMGCASSQYVEVNSGLPGRVAVFDGKGTEFAPCELDSTLLDSHASKSQELPLCRWPHFYLNQAESIASLSQCMASPIDCEPKEHIGETIEENSCSLCNGQHCKCASTSTGDAAQSIMRNMAYDRQSQTKIGKQFNLDNLKTNVISFNIFFGAPLKDFDNSTSGGCDTFGCIGAQTAVFRRDYANEIRRKLERFGWDNPNAEFEVYLWWPTMLFETFIAILVVDMGLVIFSILFVFIYMAVHTKSVFLSAAAMIHILMSIPMAFCIYTYIFQIKVFYILNFMSVYIILAIGADDVFVFMDAFNQFSFLPLYDRLRQAYYRASKAMLITSLTTCGAFMVTAINSLNDIACFGIFTAVLVAINFFYVITYFTATVLFYERYVHHCCCVCNTEQVVPSDKDKRPYKSLVYECCICDSQRRQFYIDRNVVPISKELQALPIDEIIHRQSSRVKSLKRAAAIVSKTSQVVAAFQSSQKKTNAARILIKPSEDPVEDLTSSKKADKADKATDTEATIIKNDKKQHDDVVLSKLDKFCAGPFFKFVTSPAKYVCVAVLTVLAVAGVVCMTQLTYTTEAEQALQESHPMQRWITSKTEDFPASSDSSMKEVNIVLGIKAPYEDREGVSRYSQEDPIVVDDPLFDLSTPAAQEFLVDICTQLPDAKEGSTYLVRQNALDDQTEEVNCFMLGLKKWVVEKGQTWPINQDDFAATVDAWLAERQQWRDAEFPPREHPPHERFEERLYMDPDKNGVIKYALINMNSTLGSYAVEYQGTKEAYEAWDSWMNEKWKDAPTELKTAYHTNKDRGNAWVFMHTQEVLLEGAFKGIAVSLAIAYIVLAVSTFNPYLALLATINITFVVACILGGTWARGWQMGTIESISATILVGLSVDYVVHFANAYMESDTDTRHQALQDALIEMGGTVMGGAITSLGASFMLFVCQFQYFAKFGFFMFLTIFLSFLYVFLFFVPLLAIIGPDKKCCAFCDLRPRTFKKRCAKQKGTVGQSPKPNESVDLQLFN